MNFDDFYENVHGNRPFPWQSRLAAQVCAGSWPKAIALPTAAGKTACIDIAVFALACGAKEAPRRIFFVVDRRIVVDQAYRHAEDLAKKLQFAKDGILKQVADKLREIAGGPDERPLDVYALRGGMYRETAWTRSPLQPTVIASTVDQVGSRLLFRGYGVSDSMKPVHAGLVGNDALILLDEAHCAKPFQQTAEAVKHYREWNESITPFRFVSMTATPLSDIDVMRADEADFAHGVLGKRIKASKPAKLVIAEKAKGKKGTDELVKELMKQAKELAKDAACVGIIVNRVKTARDLKTALGEEAVLLTGRMRPLDRDRLFEEKLKPLLSNADGTPPKFVVGTQCLEVGADFDFHALVSECASLDALRQRFGRLNRVARRDTANAVIVVRGDETDDTSEDPIYGASLGNTWKWLKEKATDNVFDFGIAAMNAKIDGIDLTPINAQSADAPVLFPAHLDCWVQTNPIPTPDPDPALFLHGPKQPGQPDVQVVFRDDLGDKKELWAEIVGLCPPSSSEAVAVPIGLFKKWLAGESFEDNTGDVEGGAVEDDDSKLEPENRFALCWKQPKFKEKAVNSDPKKDELESIVTDPKKVKPNRTYVVPCSLEAKMLGDFATNPPDDYAEEAFQRSRDKAFLRLPDVVVPEDASKKDTEALIDSAIEQRRNDDSPEWEIRAIENLTNPRNRLINKHPCGGFVVTGRRRLKQFDPEFLDDDASSYSPGNRAVTLVDHSRGVADCAAKFALGCGLPVELYYQAGLLHDLGKLDPRFQAMLRQCSPRTAVGIPLAKSANGPRNKRERDEARLVHRYPSGARHELLSCAILESSDDDLMHLIATHHGSARPFADAVEENDAASPFRVDLFEFKREMSTSKQEIAKWNAELPERFWKMVRKHGWWGSAYREAVFRLADHAQSRAEQEDGWKLAAVKALPVATFTMKKSKEPSYPLPLPGLDGSNPLAFLAALGTLRLANRAFPGARLSWESRGTWSAVLHLPQEVPPDELVDALLKNAGVGRRCVSFALDLKILATEFQNFEREAVGYAHEDRDFADFLRAFADPLVTIQAGPNAGKTKPTEFYLIAGQQKMLKQALEIAAAASASHLHKCLFDPWVYDDPIDGLSLRWDPQDDFRYATRFFNPSKDRSKGKRGSVLGAHRLAFEGLPFFPCFAVGTRLATTGFTNLQRRPFFSWPLWTASWGVDAVRSVLTSIEPPKSKAKIQQVVIPKQLGVSAWYQCEKVPNSDYFNFAPAQVI